MKDETISIHGGQKIDSETGARAVPIYQTTSFCFKNSEHAANLFALKEFGNIYTRLMNPTTDVLEKRLTQLDGGTGALVTSSGMSAIFLAIHNLASAGDHIVSSSSLYGGTDTLFRYTFPRMKIDVDFVEPVAEKIGEKIKENTKAIYIETIGNPRGDVPDIKKIADIAHKNKIPLIVDNTFAPIICKPFEHGADIIVYSCTKWIGGHGTTMGGAIIDGGKFDFGNGKFPEFTTPDKSYNNLILWDTFKNVPDMGNIAYIIKARVDGMRNIGMCISPQSSFLILQGVETLSMRMKKHCENAIKLAEYLEKNENVKSVNYLGLETHKSNSIAKKYLNGGFGSVLGFRLKNGKKSAENFIKNVKLSSHLANVGDAKTLVIHPASTTHAQVSEDVQKTIGIYPDFVRVSVGIENIEDIIEDFKQAL